MLELHVVGLERTTYIIFLPYGLAKCLRLDNMSVGVGMGALKLDGDIQEVGGSSPTKF